MRVWIVVRILTVITRTTQPDNPSHQKTMWATDKHLWHDRNKYEERSTCFDNTISNYAITPYWYLKHATSHSRRWWNFAVLNASMPEIHPNRVWNLRFYRTQTYWFHVRYQILIAAVMKSQVFRVWRRADL